MWHPQIYSHKQDIKDKLNTEKQCRRHIKSVSLPQVTLTIGVEQRFQLGDAFLNQFAVIRVRHQPACRELLHDEGVGVPAVAIGIRLKPPPEVAGATVPRTDTIFRW